VLPVLQNSFKNTTANSEVKIAPLFREACLALVEFKEKSDHTTNGLIFKSDKGELLTYRQIQHSYDLLLNELICLQRYTRDEAWGRKYGIQPN
jgi:hypothetical protein